MSSIVINRKNLRHPPGPQGHWLWGTMRELQHQPLETFTQMVAQYGHAVRFHFFLHYYGHLFTHPDHIKHILQDNNRNYTKLPHPSFVLLQKLLGDGLLTSDGDFWRHQRRLIQPAFHRRRIAEFGQIMTDATEMMLQKWQQGYKAERPLDIDQEMMRLTLEIVGQALFSIDITAEAEVVGEAFTAVNEQISEMTTRPFAAYTINITGWPGNGRLNRNIEALNGVVDKIIAQRRQQPLAENENDLLGLLMAATDEETGHQMDDQQVRDEVMTLLLAGHETTSNALTWTFYLLSEHRDVRRKLETELAEVLNGRTPVITDIPNLVYTRMVIDESMRLYPPAYFIGRWCNAADEIGGYDVPANSVVATSPYITHRHADFWPKPERFDPQRFTPERVAERPRYAYLPFGGGPRQCIGNTFALTEATLILATIAQRYRLDLVPGHPVAIDPLITLRPLHGLSVHLRPHSAMMA